VLLPAEGGRHLYNVRAGIDLGETEQVTLPSEPGDTLLLASLPYEVTGVQFVGLGSVKRGEVCSFRVTVLADQTPGDHVVRLEVVDPSGAVARHYCANLLTAAGVADVSIPFAPNDAVGTWTVTVRDLISGHSLDSAVEVSE